MQDSITKILKAIVDPTRSEIFHGLILATTVLSITQISDQFNISRQRVTKHIKTLENAGLVYSSTQGRERYCHVDIVPLKEINQWLNAYVQFWDRSLDNLGTYLDNKA